MRPEPVLTPAQSHRPQPHRRRQRRVTDRGQAIGLILIAVAVIGSILIAVGMVGARLHDRSTAETAADAAALAGALEGAGAAREVAARNGARLVRYAETHTGTGVVVTVEVTVDGVAATARASTEP